MVVFLCAWFKSVLGNIVSFRVHAPNSGAFLLDIFANSVTPKEYLTGEPMKFKSVCKFKIICEELQTVMVPLPDCASGEWGPTKATRLFGLIPISHQVTVRKPTYGQTGRANYVPNNVSSEIVPHVISR